jgi:hypothetical protein
VIFAVVVDVEKAFHIVPYTIISEELPSDSNTIPLGLGGVGAERVEVSDLADSSFALSIST